MTRLHIDKSLAKSCTTVAVVLPSVCALCGAVDSPKSDLAHLRAQFQAKLDALQTEHGFPGATAAFILDDGRYAAVATGDANIERSIRMQPDSVMPAGSIGKSFVAAVVLDLLREGKLQLDGKVKEWFRENDWYNRLPNAHDITVRMLLNHSSGLSDYLVADRMFMALLETVSKKIDFPFSHEEMLQELVDRQPLFPAGKGFGYTDSNYIMLGLIIERATGGDYYDVLRERILAPLQLKTVTPCNRRAIPHLASGYMPEGNRFRLPTKIAERGKLLYDPSFEWTGGGLAMTATDLVRWAKIFYGGGTIKSAYLEEMIESANGDMEKLGYQYGLGVQLMKMSPGRVYGHGGWIFAYTSGTYYFLENGFPVAIQLNKVDRGYTKYAEPLAAVVFEFQKIKESKERGQQ